MNNEKLQNIDIEWFHTWFNNAFSIIIKKIIKPLLSFSPECVQHCVASAELHMRI